jgi:hypothetical protein
VGRSSELWRTLSRISVWGRHILRARQHRVSPDPAKPNGYRPYRGYFGEAQRGFIRNVLAIVPRDSLVVYSFHIPLRTLPGDKPSIAIVDTREFLAAISTHPNSVSFSGHTHTNEHRHFGEAEGFVGGTHHPPRTCRGVR